jgi:ectoine hydroxylase-related dioxygenase (phytanoyl-CoA dioxygenase family)
VTNGRRRSGHTATVRISTGGAPNLEGMTTWFTTADCRLDDFRTVVEQKTDRSDYPYAADMDSNVLLYAADVVRAPRAEVAAELARALSSGPGIVVFKRAFAADVVDRATDIFFAMIAEQKAAGVAGGDHFAKPGANDRVWGALDKFALRDPAAFADYYANDVLALISNAWLGPGYQVTSQINVVNPGGTAQAAHRDYHLGFMSAEQAQRYPAHAHLLTPALTLQGAVAHVDMPVETGPTLYLPHSQKYGPGYLAYHRPEFTAYFEENYVQLALEKGDAAFFNPALFHGAGTNRSADVRRMANLLQVSSAFGRAMETVDRTAMSLALYPVLRAFPGSVHNVVAASAEGYAFPTDLDLDQPIGGLAPQTQAELVLQALAEDWAPEAFADALRRQQGRRSHH